MSLKPTTVPTKILASSINASATSFTLNNILGWDGTALAAADFGSQAYCVFRNSARTQIEIMEFNPATIASASITITRRGLDFTGDLTTEVAANKLTWVKGDTFVDLGTDTPQLWQFIKEYVDGIAIAGSPDATTTSKGLFEGSTPTEVTNGTASGGTGAPLAVTPDALQSSSYGVIISAFTGVILPYGGITAPTGFNMCDGSTLTLATYPTLGGILLGRYGYGTGVTFTANAGSDLITATSHGLSDGARLLLASTTSLPAGLSANTIYFVRDSTTNTFKLATTAGGTAIDITDAGSGTHSFYVSFLVPDMRSRFPIGYSASAPTKTFTFASRSSNTITVTGADNHAHNEIQTGQAVLYDTTSGVITGLTDNTTYYLIRVTATSFQLATSVANANAGTAIALSSDGSGTQTFAITYTARTMGHTGGEEMHALTDNELPSHLHDWWNNSGGAGGNSNFQTTSAASQAQASGVEYIVPTGGDAPHSIMPLFTVVNYIIKT